MDTKKKQETSTIEEEEFFSLKDFFMLCVRNWVWFVGAVIIFIGLGAFYIARQEPRYKRTCSVLIQNQEQGASASIASAFAQMGLVANNTKVNNELIGLTSPAVMDEVVERLHLNINVAEKGTFHPTTLYGTTNPVTPTFIDLGTTGSGGFSAELQPNGTVRLYKFWKSTPDGIDKLDGEATGRLGMDIIKTPLGRVTLLRNPGFTGRLKKEMQLDIWQNSQQSTAETYTGRLKGDLTDRDADVIDLTIEDVSIQRAVDVLNTVIQVYNERWIEDKNKLGLATNDFIKKRLIAIEQDLNLVDSDISAFQSEHRVLDMKTTAEQTVRQGMEIDQKIMEQSNELAMARYVKEYMQQPDNRYSVIPANLGLKDIDVSAMAQYNNIALARENLIDNSGPNNPLVKDYEVQLQGYRNAIMKSLNARIGVLQSGLSSINAAKGKTEAELAAAPQEAKYLLSIGRQQKVKEELYLFLLQKLEENELSKTFTAYQTRIITPPYGSMKPVAPKKALILAVCFVLGIAVPGVIIYVIEATNTKIRSRRDLEDLVVPFAGEIPQVGSRHRLANLFKTRKARKKESEKPRIVVGEGRRDIPNEAFRVVRSNLDFMLSQHPGGSVLAVTSFNPGSGKSFIVYNLGLSFALKGRKVLVIDGDLRHGSLSTYIDSPKKGLSLFLPGKLKNWHDVVYHSPHSPLLDVMPIGHRPPNPAELLDVPNLPHLIREARAEYDVILIDCPPINIVVDTHIITKYVDRTIFVLRAGLLDKSALAELTELYNEQKIKHISVMLNGTQSNFSSYYAYGTYQAFKPDEKDDEEDE